MKAKRADWVKSAMRAGIFLALWMTASATASAKLADDGWDLALSLGIPGKGGWKTCYTYAKALQLRFDGARGESHLVIYDWTSPLHEKGRHAFLVYRDAEGRYWGVDNLSPQPRWMVGTTPAEWAVFWAGPCAVSRVIEGTNPKFAGRTADKSFLDKAPTLVADNHPATPSLHHKVAKI